MRLMYICASILEMTREYARDLEIFDFYHDVKSTMFVEAAAVLFVVVVSTIVTTTVTIANVVGVLILVPRCVRVHVRVGARPQSRHVRSLGMQYPGFRLANIHDSHRCMQSSIPSN